MARRSVDSLTGCHAAQRLLHRVAGDPYAAPAALGIVGRGGTGKSALLDGLDRVYTDAGTRVWRGAPGRGVEPPADGVLLIDDAQWLKDDALQALTRLADQPNGLRLVVAHRPWPRPKALAALDTVLARDRPLVVLGHLDREAVAERAGELLGVPPQQALLDVLHGWTGGLPAYVDSLTAALLDDGQINAGRLRGVPRMPAAVVEVIRAKLDQLDPVALSLLAALSLDAPLDEALLSMLLDVDPVEIAHAIEAAQSAGLMSPDGTLLLIVRHAVARLTPLLQRHALQERLAGLIIERGGSTLAAGKHLLGTGVTGRRAAQLLEAAGQEALAESAQLAWSLFEQAVKAGARPDVLAARRAEAAAIAGDLDAALRLADQAVTHPAMPDRIRGIRVAAAVLAHRGLLARSAMLHRSLAQQSAGAEAASAHLLAVPGLVGTGNVEEAEDALSSGEGETQRPLSLLADAVALTGRGVYDSVCGSPTAALSALVQASSLLESSGCLVLLPDTPAVLAAVVAHHSGDFDVADSVLERAIAAGVGEPLTAPRHRLLQSWTALLRGNSALARSLLDLAAPPTGRFAPRDELFATAIEVGIARRQGDLDGLIAAWRGARETLMRHPVDLFVLQPVGELAAGAARLGELRWIQPFLDQAWNLLERLGKPPLWTVAMHWWGLQVAIVMENHETARRHADALSGMSAASRYAGALAAAGQSWARILRADVDAGTVEAAAQGLQDAGMVWDAARLAGQAAIRARDPKVMRALLTSARAMQALTAPAPDPSDGAVLSEREREVASCVLSGLTYKEIGAQLFISSKTVEHHVARIRQRVGATTRAELLAKLRALFATVETTPP
jgi:DNA-binding CsgD family transcriptional regulator